MKFKLEILFILTFITSLTFGQNPELTNDKNKNTVEKINFIDPETCEQIDELIKTDFKNDNVYLFLNGGIAPVEYTTDKDFENKYGIHFYDFGCEPPNEKCVIEYNSRVFDYLTETYGKKWKREIRDDVIGFKEWKRTSKRK